MLLLIRLWSTFLEQTVVEIERRSSFLRRNSQVLSLIFNIIIQVIPFLLLK